MRWVFVNYFKANDFQDPEAWLNQIPFYTGILEALAINNEVISLEKTQFKGEISRNLVRYCFIKNIPSRIKSFIYLNQFIKALNPDFILVHSFLFPIQVWHLRYLMNRRVKILVQNHAEKPSRGLKKWLQALASTQVDAFLFASKELGYTWVDSGNIRSRNQIFEVMEVSSPFYPVRREEAIARTGMRGSLIFLWVGRLEKNKDPITVIKGFLFYALTHKEAKLYMIYQSHELLEEISILMKNSSQKDSIILIGKIPYEELFYWYSSADILISGSHYEGSGTAIAEAMSCGCMPILTDIFPFRMLTNNEKCGYLFQPGNPESLGKILMELKEEEVLLRKKLAFQFFQSHLSFQAIAKKIQDISSGF